MLSFLPVSRSAIPPQVYCHLAYVAGNMVIKLYGSAMSTSRVLVTILEKNLPYELVLVDISKGEHKSDDFKQKQPFGKVPALEDDGFWMFESRAICKYLEK
jgi:glutathione S-transferase